MWRQDEFERLSFRGVLDRMVAAFDDAGDPMLRLLLPGRSRDEVESRLSEVTATPHPDVIEWFRFQDGYERPAPSMTPTGGPVGLELAAELWADHEDLMGHGAYEGYRSSFVPVMLHGGVNCDPVDLPGVYVDLHPHGVESYAPSLAYVCWFWTALREERLSYYVERDGAIELIVRDYEEVKKLGERFHEQRLLPEFGRQDTTWPLGIA